MNRMLNDALRQECAMMAQRFRGYGYLLNEHIRRYIRIVMDE